MSGRIEVDRSLPPVTMNARLFNELREHARETHPEECCGLLVGAAAGAYASVHRCRNDMTRLHRSDPARYPRDGRRAFHMNEMDYMGVLQEAERAGRTVVAVYHSHADAAAYFSELDQAYALQPLFPFPGADHIVISVVEGLVKEAALFRRPDGRGTEFEGRLLEPEAP